MFVIVSEMEIGVGRTLQGWMSSTQHSLFDSTEYMLSLEVVTDLSDSRFPMDLSTLPSSQPSC